LRPAVFLDRDGTLNRLPPLGEYVADPHELELLEGVVDAVRLLRSTGYACVVVSNQRGVALGRMSEEALNAVDARLRELVELDGTYYCTHHLDAGCGCRKPAPGLLLRAADDLALDLGSSVIIGDSPGDVEAGRRAGCRGIRVEPRAGQLLLAARGLAGDASLMLSEALVEAAL
jgi:histidinol-phosphate phosphatase family protein